MINAVQNSLNELNLSILELKGTKIQLGFFKIHFFPA